MTVVFSPESRKDLRTIRQHCQEAMETQHSADRVIDRILEACEIIDSYPRIGRRFEELTDADWRCVVCGRYLIFYSIADSIVIENPRWSA